MTSDAFYSHCNCSYWATYVSKSVASLYDILVKSVGTVFGEFILSPMTCWQRLCLTFHQLVTKSNKTQTINHVYSPQMHSGKHSCSRCISYALKLHFLWTLTSQKDFHSKLVIQTTVSKTVTLSKNSQMVNIRADSRRVCLLHRNDSNKDTAWKARNKTTLSLVVVEVTWIAAP